MSDKELIARLRDGVGTNSYQFEMNREAADALERLTAEHPQHLSEIMRLNVLVENLTAERDELVIAAKYAEHIDTTPENQLQTMLYDTLVERDALKSGTNYMAVGNAIAAMESARAERDEGMEVIKALNDEADALKEQLHNASLLIYEGSMAKTERDGMSAENEKLSNVIKILDAALIKQNPEGASGEVFDLWNMARAALGDKT